MMNKKPAPKKPVPSPTVPMGMKRMAQIMHRKVQRTDKRGK